MTGLICEGQTIEAMAWWAIIECASISRSFAWHAATAMPKNKEAGQDFDAKSGLMIERHHRMANWLAARNARKVARLEAKLYDGGTDSEWFVD